MKDTEPRSSNNDFSSRNLNILLGDDPEAIERLLNEARLSYIDLLSRTDSEQIPGPISSISVKAFIHNKPELVIPTIEGCITIPPLSLEAVAGAWPDDVFEALKALFESASPHGDVYQLSHDPFALYITLDTTYVMRIALESSATAVSLRTSIALREHVQAATGAAFETKLTSTVTSIQAVEHTLTAIGCAVQKIQEVYPNNPQADAQKSRIPLSIEPTEPIVDLTETPTELAQDTPAPSLMPESERVTKEHRGFDLIGGATHAKERLLEFAFAITDPEGAALYDVHPNHFLLHGPPGVGKTSLVTALGHEIGATVRYIDCSEVVEKWVGSSAKNLKTIFARAKQKGGTAILFFDEFDSLASGDERANSERGNVKKLFNTELEDLSKNHPTIIVAAATNASLDSLEQSLIRSGRIETIAVPLPNRQERMDIWGTVFFASLQTFRTSEPLMIDENGLEVQDENSFMPYADDIDLTELAALTEGMTGSDFKKILERARKKCFAEYHKTKVRVKIHQLDLLEVIRTFNH